MKGLSGGYAREGGGGLSTVKGLSGLYTGGREGGREEDYLL